MASKTFQKERHQKRISPNHRRESGHFWKLVNKSPLSHERIIGRAAENLTIWYLKSRGWVIRGRNFATKHGEIDIIAMRQNADMKGMLTIAFIEVKSSSRMHGLSPLLSVSREKRRRMNNTIRDWIGAHPREKAIYRRDIASVCIVRHRLPSIRYIPGAFTNDDPYGW